MVALEMDRKFIYNDVSEDKVLIAKKRIEDYKKRDLAQPVRANDS